MFSSLRRRHVRDTPNKRRTLSLQCLEERQVLSAMSVTDAVCGAFIGALGLWAARIRHEPLVWSYLFAITWIAAIGGEFIEGLDKMAAMAAPGVIWLAFSWRSDQPGATASGARGGEK